MVSIVVVVSPWGSTSLVCHRLDDFASRIAVRESNVLIFALFGDVRPLRVLIPGILAPPVVFP